jgi:hypothetical protein
VNRSEPSESKHTSPLITIRTVLAASVLVGALSGCRFFGGAEPTRTPIPTFTPTPILVVLPAGAVPEESTVQPGSAGEPQVADVGQPAQPVEPAQPTATATPLPTSTPTMPPTSTPTQTPEPSPTPTSTPSPTPLPQYPFELETAQKFPTTVLAPGVVRIDAYVYAPGTFGLPDYGLRIIHNGALLESESLSKEGLPATTRSVPGPYTRFTNLSVIIVEAEAGDWVLQLEDDAGQPVGPPATFTIDAGEETRELYLRYRLEDE